MKKWTFFLLMLLISHLAANSQSDLNGVAVGNAKIPFYNRGTLQSMIFAAKAEYRAQLLYGYDVVINMLKKKVNPDRIHNDWGLKLYPLNASLKEVAAFWKKRLDYCDAVLFSQEGALNQAERAASGDKEIFLRSPMLDLDGVGFAADFKRRQIKVNSHVNLVLRTPKSDPGKFGNNIPSAYEHITGSSDMLHMDTANRRVMLLGRVVVRDGQMQLTCDRLTIVLGGNSKEKEKSNMDFSGVRMLYADGNVKVIKLLAPGTPASESQELKGDHLVYDTAKEILTVSGDRALPEIKSGKGFVLRGRELVYFRAKMQMIVPANCWMMIDQKGVKRYLISNYGNFNFNTGICDFLGNVRGSAPQHELACQKMRVILQRKGQKKSVSAASATPLSGAGGFDTGSLEFSRAICRGGFKMFRRENKGVSTLDSDEAELNYLTDKAVFTGNVKTVSAGNTLETPLLMLNLKRSATDPENRELASVEALRGVKVTSAAAPNGEKTVLTASKGFFDYVADRIDFIGNVKGHRGKATLSGDLLELFLGASPKGADAVGIPGLAAGATGSSRTLKRAVITGNGVVQDEGNTMQGDKLEYFFEPAKRGAPQAPGMFQSGSLRLTQMLANGNVKLKSISTSEQEKKAAPGVMMGRNTAFKELLAQQMVSDFRTHTTVFSEAVSMTDGTNKMNCNKLELFAKPQKTAAYMSEKPADADPDADPFALPVEKGVPRSIVVGKGLELDRAVASGNVVIDRREKPDVEGEKVYCERAVFEGTSQTVVCTGSKNNRPKAVGSGKTHTADKFTIFLQDEHMESSGDTITE